GDVYKRQVFTLLFAMLWLGERWQPHHWVALPLAGAGLYLIATHGEGNLTLFAFCFFYKSAPADDHQ
ncbi:hypothetical protein ACQ4LF_25690, partial [Aeromonas salmonicida]